MFDFVRHQKEHFQIDQAGECVRVYLGDAIIAKVQLFQIIEPVEHFSLQRGEIVFVEVEFFQFGQSTERKLVDEIDFIAAQIEHG